MSDMGAILLPCGPRRRPWYKVVAGFTISAVAMCAVLSAVRNSVISSHLFTYGADVDMGILRGLFSSSALARSGIPRRMKGTNALKALHVPYVIGAGRPHTIPAGLPVALQMLGYKVAYDWTNSKNESALWCRWQKGQGTLDDAIDDVLRQGYNAFLGDPFDNVYKEFMRRLPDAKVLFTDHPRGPLGWTQTIRQVWSNSPLGAPRKSCKARWYKMYTDCDMDRIYEDNWPRRCALGYDEWINQVPRDVPSNKFLKFDASMGWDPLVAFLGVAAPPGPFPVDKTAHVAR